MPGVLLSLVCLDWRLALAMMVGSTNPNPSPMMMMITCGGYMYTCIRL